MTPAPEPDAVPESARPALDCEFPPYFEEYMRPAEVKVLHGGRGSAKSQSVARGYICEAVTKKYRYLCTREFQSSMADSVIKLLSDQIYALGLGKYYDVGKTGIQSCTGSEFLFKGLKLNPQSIRSTEAIDRCWVEEAHTVSNASWDVLEPTLFRTPDFELTVTFNSDLDTDPTYVRYVKNPPPGAIVNKRPLTWRDNPWFPPGLDRLRRHMQELDPDAYDWIWEGNCRKLSDAVIFRKRVSVEAFETPDDARFYFGGDWGFANSPTALIRCFIHNDVLFVDAEAYGWHVELDDLGAMFDTVPGARTWRILADNARPETISYMQRHGFPRIEGCQKWPGSVEDGIAVLKAFKRIVVHPRCKNIIEEFKLYSYKTDPKTGEVLPIIVDKHNHGIDSLRYALEDLIMGRGALEISDSVLAWAAMAQRR